MSIDFRGRQVLVMGWSLLWVVTAACLEAGRAWLWLYSGAGPLPARLGSTQRSKTVDEKANERGSA